MITKVSKKSDRHSHMDARAVLQILENRIYMRMLVQDLYWHEQVLPRPQTSAASDFGSPPLFSPRPILMGPPLDLRPFSSRHFAKRSGLKSNTRQQV